MQSLSQNYGSYIPVPTAQRAQYQNFTCSAQEALDLCKYALDDWKVFTFVMNVLSAQLEENFTEWQVKQIFTNTDAGIRELLDCRFRGGSKSRDGSICCVLIAGAEANTKGMWLSGDTAQLKQAISYINAVHDKTFLGVIFRVRNDKFTHSKEAIFINGSTIGYNPSTATSGPRTNLLWFDEEGKITKSNLIENNRNSYGMVSSAKGRLRIRHTTTLAIGTPAQEVYEKLRKKNTVFIHLPEEATWWNAEQWNYLSELKLSMPSWWINCEYNCRLDAPGGRVFTDQHDLSLFALPVDSPILLAPGNVLNIIRPGETKSVPFTISSHWIAQAGTDWNPSWGHTVVIAITDGTEFFIVDEFRGTNLEYMAEFIKRWQNHPFWGKKFTYVAEKQGALKSTQSRADTLRNLGVNITSEENFAIGEQIQKLSYAEALNEQKRLHFATYCGVTIRQAQFYRRDEDSGLPAKRQDDHMIDAMLHMFNPPTIQVITSTGFNKWR